jgi:ribosome-binding ATPase
MGFNCGIVGLPNVGKSTIFNALTDAGAQAANYPFCTIDPNKGIVPVPDQRLLKIQEICPSEKQVLTAIEVVDIAGLVKGASQGEGLGNQFLAHIAEVDAILEVVRVFDDDQVTHVHGSVDAQRDVSIIGTELVLRDMETLNNIKDRLTRQSKGMDKKAKATIPVLERGLSYLNQEKPLRRQTWSVEEREILDPYHLLTFKPILYVANVAENALTAPDTEALKQLRQIAAEDNSSVVLISGKIEEEIAQLDAEEKKAFLDSMGLEESGLDRLAREGHRLLELITFFTSGPKENRAWTVGKGSTAPQAAGKIHSDFERGFICADVIAYDDFVSCQGELGAKQKGKMRVEGKSYKMQDGDVVHFKFNV